MCVVSFIGDNFRDRWDDKDWIKPYLNPAPTNPFNIQQGMTPIEKKEFEDLKKEVEIMKELLKKAKIYDEVNNEPDCEMEDKVKFLREVAKFVGIDLDEIFKPKE